jgi:hypothetical protein
MIVLSKRQQEEGWSGGKIEWKLPEVNASALSRGENELIAAGDVFSTGSRL